MEIPEFLIESRFLKPGYRSGSANRLRVVVPDCYVLVIPPELNVGSYKVSNFVAWGEEIGFNRRSVTRNQSEVDPRNWTGSQVGILLLN